MLTEKEYGLNVFYFNTFLKLCLIPIEINGVDVKRPTSKRLVLWSLLVTVQVLSFVMALWLMVNKVRSVGQDEIPTLTFDYAFIALVTVGMYAGIQNFIRWPEVAQSVLKSVKVCDTNKCERKGAIFGYTFLEIYTMLAPLGVYPAIFTLVIAHYVIYISPITERLHVVLRIAPILVEALVMMSLASWCHFGIIIHITFMEKVVFIVKTQLKQLEDGDQNQGIQESIQKLIALQVEANAFNASQKNLIFALKLGAMCAVIFCGFAAIQFFHGNLLIVMCNVLMMAEALFAFGMSYTKGFSIPRSIQSLQRSLLLHVRLNGGDPRPMVLSRQLKSVKKMAVSVGNFHHLRRVSTTNFVDFSVKNIVRLVMFYRRHHA